ncbi:hypothetical protein [Flavobacterium chungbukense]|uniref:NACHT domain-containing protein n=1 Tax=Flavobacterium chungbukense TaxID=877464 RepID=A0ABP7YWB7_9FLAO|nr:hypothetical protein [Flavobacterium chungbukense]MCC4923242.1 hypothetical protein [Flavobacterium chungbukense]
MSNLINWENLKSYEDDQKKSFEELCYQLVFEIYGAQGKLHSIDDSGGGDGVEFYLELPNGDIWGWQCKFFGRFNESGRHEQIKKSLQKAADVHKSRLKKWYLCSKLSMTSGERDWLENVGVLSHKGRSVLAAGCSPELIHWGDSEILNYLRIYSNVHRYFFTDKILDFNWFREKFEIVRQSRIIRSKYLEELHIEGTADETVTKFLGGTALRALIKDKCDEFGIQKFETEYAMAIDVLKGYEALEEFKETVQEISGFILSECHSGIIKRGNELLVRLSSVLEDKELHERQLVLHEIGDFIVEYQKYFDQYAELSQNDSITAISLKAERKETDQSLKKRIRNCRDSMLGPYFIMRNFESYLSLFEPVQHLNESELYITGKASKGKTHLAVDTVRRQIDSGKPALFLFGSHFKSNLPVKEQMKQMLDIPSEWTVKDFFGALEICARVHKTKLLLAIDGLNESSYWKEIWGDAIEEIAGEIRLHFPNILLMATYRSSYEEVLFPKDYLSYPEGKWKLKEEVKGFSSLNVNEAVDRYFKHYDITLENNSERIYHFAEPLYLTIFCEAKKGEIVSFQDEDMFDIFEDYLKKCNENITGRLGRDVRYHKSFTKDILNKIASVLWRSDQREIALHDAVPNLLDTEMLQAFEGEDLLIYRDWDQREVVAFTYDLLNGYLIAKSILDEAGDANDLKAIINSDKFTESLLGRIPKHSLFEDILRSFCILAIKRYGLESLRSESDLLSKYAVAALFDLNAGLVRSFEAEAKEMVRTDFNNYSRTWSVIDLFDITELVIEHPLNFLFLSDLLLTMPVSLRDMFWTEKCRENYVPEREGNNHGYINHFESANRDKREISPRVHIAARRVMWMLTVTNRDMRDRATRALYYYGRRFPKEFVELVCYSLGINDPYVWERTLGALYGVVLAGQAGTDSSFREKHLKPIAQMLYRLIFADEAPYGTTHILARSYAAMSIETALKHYPELLGETEQSQIRAPYKSGGIREWGEFDYENQGSSFIDPIHMDFSNYTIGQIVSEGRNYNDPDSKKKVRRQIYWRIFELGWDGVIFEEMDSRILRMDYERNSEKGKTERYGKKYSWIAFYEVAGLMDDEELLENEYGDFRIIYPDIDVSFPEEVRENKTSFVKTDYLADRKLSLMDWYKNGGGVEVSDYLTVADLNGHSGQWICMDGFICQEDKSIQRERFIFIRALLVKNNDLEDVLARLQAQDLGGRWLPEKRENHNCFAGEMYLFEGAVYNNFTELTFIEDTQRYKVKKGHEEYHSTFNFETFAKEYPDEVEIVKNIEKKFQILLPVMEFAFSSESITNNAGHRTVISKELYKELKLTNEPHSFDLKDSNNYKASQRIDYNLDSNNKHHFVYVRKDLLDIFITENDYSLVWAVWGERQFSLGDVKEMRRLHAESGLEKFPVFQSVEVYKQ